ncbi:MAG: apolipoprotein N-acyltransferase [Gammaproteobacteria bacterium]
MTFISDKHFDWMAPLFGASMTLAFAPFEYYYVVLVGLVFLAASWHRLPPRRAALRGLLFGLGWYGTGVSWVFVSVYQYGKAGMAVSLLLTALFVSVWAMFTALTGYLTAVLSRRTGSFHYVLLFTCVWTLMEYVRGSWFLNGFPWFQIAYTGLLAGYIPIIGVYGTGFLITALAACVWGWWQRKPEGTVYVFSILAVIFADYLLRNVEWTQPSGPKIKVSIIQGNISQDRKWAQDNKEKTLEKYKSLTEAHWDSDLVVWPETSIPAFFHEVKDNFLMTMNEAAARSRTDIVVSLPMEDEQEDRYFNTVLVLGRTPGIYRKRHLLPFGEYLPFKPVSEYLMELAGLHLGQFTPGRDDQPLLIGAGFPFITSICYEDAFGSHNVSQPNAAAYLVNLTNDAWFGRSIEPYQHLQIAQMRALETGRFMIRATNTGLSAVVDPNGNIRARAPLFETDVLTAAIRPMSGLTPENGR